MVTREFGKEKKKSSFVIATVCKKDEQKSTFKTDLFFFSKNCAVTLKTGQGQFHFCDFDFIFLTHSVLTLFK